MLPTRTVNAAPAAPVSDSELWQKLSTRERAHRVVPFPVRRGAEAVGDVAIVALSAREKTTALAEASRVARSYIKERVQNGEHVEGYEQVYANLVATEILQHACRRTDDIMIPIFPGAAAIRESFTYDEVGALMGAYAEVQAELGPIVSELSPEELDAWIARLTAGGRAQLGFFSREALIDLASGLAARIATSQTDNSSPGSQPDDTQHSPATDDVTALPA